MQQIKEKVKFIVSNIFNSHIEGDKKDIIILSSPRSGSTWLMELLYSQPGVKFINEPLCKVILDYNKFFPIETKWNYLTLSELEKKIIKNYFKNDFPINHFGPINFFKKNYNYITDRRVIKVIRANPLIKWLKEELKFNIIYLVRHPIAQSISCIERGHYPFYKSRKISDEEPEYFTEEKFLKENLENHQIEFVFDIYKSGTKLEKFVTEWCLDNIIPLRILNDLKFVLTYEELLINSKAVIEMLSKKLKLGRKDLILSKLNVPSKTSNSSSKLTKSKIRKGDPCFLLKKWKREISPKEEIRLFEILKKFNISEYQPDKYISNDVLINLETTKNEYDVCIN